MKPAPLPLMARRLAPFVAAGLIGYAEALDSIMEIVVQRGDWTAGRLLEIEDWAGRVLTRHIDVCPPVIVARYQRYAARCQRGVDSVRAAPLPDPHKMPMMTVSMQTPAG